MGKKCVTTERLAGTDGNGELVFVPAGTYAEVTEEDEPGEVILWDEGERVEIRHVVAVQYRLI